MLYYTDHTVVGVIQFLIEKNGEWVCGLLCFIMRVKIERIPNSNLL